MKTLKEVISTLKQEEHLINMDISKSQLVDELKKDIFKYNEKKSRASNILKEIESHPEKYKEGGALDFFKTILKKQSLDGYKESIETREKILELLNNY